jgi:hypothetical protein
MSATPTELANQDDPIALAQDLEAGVKADIWYDASEHGDEEAGEIIERTQTAMERAARLLRALAPTN